ncbi:hypothetical protein [Roseomonas elaeocarpi]|uniref:Uncharacterized protein n=1 Tax=Roseomonas elaeocarpi TaxID=907779 RepID=A0ABV6JRQ0_9PROT
MKPRRLIKVARLVDGGIQPFTGATTTAAKRTELLDLWERLSPSGRHTVLLAARLTAREEDVLPPGTSILG